MRFATTIALVTNHLDAWVVALAVAVVALAVHGRLRPETLPLVLVMATGYWLAFALNDYFDAPADSLDPDKSRRNAFTHRDWNRRWFWIPAIGLAVFISGYLFTFGWLGVLVVAMSGVIAWSYSAPPIRFKDRPGLDVLVHALFVETYPYVLVLTLLGLAWTALDAFIVTLLIGASLSAQLEQQLRDFDRDLTVGRTFATVAGRRVTHVLLVVASASLLVLAGLFWAVWGVPVFLMPYGLIVLPALLHRLWRGPHRARSQHLVLWTALVGLAYTLWLLLQHLAHRPA